MQADPHEIIERFEVDGPCDSIEPLTAGHINDSYIVRCRARKSTRRYFLQRINSEVFQDVAGLMNNVARVSEHIRQRLSRGDDEPRVPVLIQSRDGAASVTDAAGRTWRLFTFVEGTRGYLRIDSPQRAAAAARAFGQFQKLLVDLPPPRLHETIPDFHHTPKRLAALEQALQRDSCNRARAAGREIEFVRRHAAIAHVIVNLQESGQIPDRVAHYDAKISNVLFDSGSDEAVCVVDLDTVMPGSMLYDFGDMVRSMTCPADEDERDLSLVGVQLPLFEAVARGYLASAGEFLTDVERAHLVAAAKVITYEQGVRFLTDFLDGDVYYRTVRTEHNLDRARNQFRLVESIIENVPAMERMFD